MVFSSVTFLVYFLPICFVLYYVIKQKYKNIFLLLASLFFYAWGEPVFVLVMLASITFNYLVGRGFGAVHHTKKRKLLLFAGVALNLLMLGVFKYAGFVAENINALLGVDTVPLPNFVLPIGISFYTFQALSYVIDLYREKVHVQKSFLDMALYISFFPQLIAGPIVKYRDIEQQLHTRKIDLQQIYFGFRRFAFGLAKKVLIANTVAFVADKIFALPTHVLGTSTAWVGILCYTLQIYFDFSGYSDMAIGLGKMFGFDFMENFNYPYISKSMQEFWRRWHISLSTWFKEYLYIPLGGNRRGAGRTYLNLLIVFFLTGLWHGAEWTFVIWGLYNGFYLVIERLFLSKLLEKCKLKVINIAYTIFAFMTGWVFFRADSLGHALRYFTSMFTYVPADIRYTPELFLNPFTVTIIVLGILLCGPLQKIPKFHTWLYNQNHTGTLATASVFVLVALSLVFVVSGTYNPFIYFRF
ncbi:MAG: MBOAT family O-acyltransferase [Christensenellaceae bacterium]|jgi:alginate O-acetyltransferase complex protein AlgI